MVGRGRKYMKEKIYGIVYSATVFCFLFVSLGSGISSASTYNEPEKGNGYHWDAMYSDCTVVPDGSTYKLDVNFEPGGDGGAYAAGGMWFTMEKVTHPDGSWYQFVKESYPMTKDKTKDGSNWISASWEWKIKQNYHEDSSESQNSGTAIRTDTFHYKIKKITYYWDGTQLSSYREGTYETQFSYNVGDGPI